MPVEQCAWQYPHTSRGVVVCWNCLGKPRPGTTPLSHSGRVKCSYCTLLVLLGARPEDTYDKGPSSWELHAPFAVVEPFWFLSLSSPT